MSYILDALKKSDEQRMASLTSKPVQLAPAHPAGHSRIGWFVLLAVIVLLCGGWLLSIYQKDQPAPRQAPAQNIPASSAPHNATQPIMPAAQPLPASIPAKTAGEPAVAASIPASPAKLAAAPQHEHPAPQPAAKPIIAAPVASVSHAPPANEEPPRRADLPVNIQQALPPIHIEGHIYDADPSARMVIINGHVHYEGQQLGDGLLLEAITESGIILNQQGTRFSMGVFDH